mmetsp:Transcript_89202/g.252315  ORF Transcript_89202/g.252315 Transcript_89202/m.252315 type:complete len:514 (-) Transcript_89202:1110-2651(-)
MAGLPGVLDEAEEGHAGEEDDGQRPAVPADHAALAGLGALREVHQGGRGPEGDGALHLPALPDARAGPRRGLHRVFANDRALRRGRLALVQCRRRRRLQLDGGQDQAPALDGPLRHGLQAPCGHQVPQHRSHHPKRDPAVHRRGRQAVDRTRRPLHPARAVREGPRRVRGGHGDRQHRPRLLPHLRRLLQVPGEPHHGAHGARGQRRRRRGRGGGPPDGPAGGSAGQTSGADLVREAAAEPPQRPRVAAAREALQGDPGEGHPLLHGGRDDRGPAEGGGPPLDPVGGFREVLRVARRPGEREGHIREGRRGQFPRRGRPGERLVRVDRDGAQASRVRPGAEGIAPGGEPEEGRRRQGEGRAGGAEPSVPLHQALGARHRPRGVAGHHRHGAGGLRRGHRAQGGDPFPDPQLRHFLGGAEVLRGRLQGVRARHQGIFLASRQRHLAEIPHPLRGPLRRPQARARAGPLRAGGGEGAGEVLPAAAHAVRQAGGGAWPCQARPLDLQPRHEGRGRG